MGAFAKQLRGEAELVEAPGGAQTEGVLPVAGREIVVQTGMESDYLIEIISDELHDGMQILNDPEGRNVSNANFGGMMVMGGAGG